MPECSLTAEYHSTCFISINLHFTRPAILCTMLKYRALTLESIWTNQHDNFPPQQYSLISVEGSTFTLHALSAWSMPHFPPLQTVSIFPHFSKPYMRYIMYQHQLSLCFHCTPFLHTSTWWRSAEKTQLINGSLGLVHAGWIGGSIFIAFGNWAAMSSYERY